MLKTKTFYAALLAAAVLVSGGLRAHAQEVTTASVHGHANDPAGVNVANGAVKLATSVNSTPSDTKFQYTFPLDANGDFKGTGIAPGTYTLVLFQQDKSVDFTRDIKFVAGADVAVNFDMSRKEYVDKMTPEQKKQLEEFKKKNAETTTENSKIKNLNGLLAGARDAIKAGNFDTAIASMQQAVTVKPDESLLWYTLGDAQLGAKKYDDAITSYKKSLEVDAASKKPRPEVASAAENNLGQALANSGKTDDAMAAYEAAAKFDPTKAGMYYMNEATVLHNLHKDDAAEAAADKTIAADPTRAVAYYIKAQSLVGKSTEDPATHKLVAPPGCIDAYQKYLELDPNGRFAPEVKEVLTSFGQTINTNYKAGKKK